VRWLKKDTERLTQNHKFNTGESQWEKKKRKWKRVFRWILMSHIFGFWYFPDYVQKAYVLHFPVTRTTIEIQPKCTAYSIRCVRSRYWQVHEYECERPDRMIRIEFLEVINRKEVERESWLFFLKKNILHFLFTNYLNIVR
jgi:hypothetical protein